MSATCVIDTPIGRVRIEAEKNTITVVAWTSEPGAPPATDLLRDTTNQLAEYFTGARRRFDLPLAPAGSQHQKKVWTEICAIPFGAYRTYGDLASEIGSSARAVGTACGKNPIPIIVPCHRILGSNGRIGGYSGRGGTTTKHQLLRHEGVRTKYRASPHLEAPEPAR